MEKNMLGKEKIREIVRSHPLNINIKDKSEYERIVQWLEDVLVDYFEYLLEKERKRWSEVKADKTDEG